MATKFYVTALVATVAVLLGDFFIEGLMLHRAPGPIALVASGLFFIEVIAAMLFIIWAKD